MHPLLHICQFQKMTRRSTTSNTFKAAPSRTKNFTEFSWSPAQGHLLPKILLLYSLGIYCPHTELVWLVAKEKPVVDPIITHKQNTFIYLMCGLSRVRIQSIQRLRVSVLTYNATNLMLISIQQASQILHVTTLDGYEFIHWWIEFGTIQRITQVFGRFALFTVVCHNLASKILRVQNLLFT